MKHSILLLYKNSSTFPPTESEKVLIWYLGEAMDWIWVNKLKFNPDEMEVQRGGIQQALEGIKLWKGLHSL